MKYGFNKFSLLYSISFSLPARNRFLPANFAIACPAAVSHSIVGPNRGYTSATPSATKHIFKELPLDITVILDFSFSNFSIKSLVSLLICEREATTT